MKKKSRWLVVVGLVLALVLVLAPTQVMAEPDNAVDPNGPYTPPAGGTFTVYIDIDAVTMLNSGQFELSYDQTVIEVKDPFAGGIRKGGLWGAVVPTVMGSFPVPGTVRVIFAYPGAGPGAGVTGSGTIVEIDFEVLAGAQPCDTSVLDMSSHGSGGVFNGMWDNWAQPITGDTWGDSSVEVSPCGGDFLKVVVSGKPLDGTLGSVGDGWVPPGFVECDEFVPCEWVWVWGWDFEYCQNYRIWIQPYGPYGDMPDPSVVEGQELKQALCPPNFPPVDPNDTPVPCPPGWEPGWVEIHINEDGTFGPVPLWHVEGEYCELWEIVADKIGPDYNEGFYNEEWDGLDAAATDAWGFHIYPEGLTIILLSLGLVAVGGYLVVRRRKGTKTAS